MLLQLRVKLLQLRVKLLPLHYLVPGTGSDSHDTGGRRFSAMSSPSTCYTRAPFCLLAYFDPGHIYSRVIRIWRNSSCTYMGSNSPALEFTSITSDSDR
jgi:hypothetical protein